MQATDILNKFKLRRTSCRQGIIDVVLAADQALSENEISNRLGGQYDRTTFYRSFKTLEEHRIIHKIVVNNLIVKYALDPAVRNKSVHAHFYCSECQTVRCMEDVPVQKYQLPDGYTGEETEVIIKGTCAICKNQIE